MLIPNSAKGNLGNGASDLEKVCCSYSVAGREEFGGAETAYGGFCFWESQVAPR